MLLRSSRGNCGRAGGSGISTELGCYSGTSNVNRVVPDLFIRFSEFDLIVEAKRWDSFQQNSNQWQNQITADANEYGNDQVPVCLIALGGIGHERR